MILLDSHVLIWWLAGSPRLGPRARDRIGRGAYVSAVSVAELTVKAMLGRLVVPDELGRRAAEVGLVELPLWAAHADALRGLPDDLVRHDPFDRMLLAQASAEGIDLLTADERLLGLGLAQVVDARS